MQLPLPKLPAPRGLLPGANAPTYTAVDAVISTLHGEEAALHKNAALVVVAAVTNGQNLSTITTTYLKEDDSQERQAAWEKAVHNAVGNAQALARGLGVTVTGYGAVSMTPPTGSFDFSNLAQTAATAMSALGSIFGGDSSAPAAMRPLQVDVTVYLDATYK